jgi:hypothetical protein
LVLVAAVVSVAFVVEVVRIGDEFQWEDGAVYSCGSTLERCVSVHRAGRPGPAGRHPPDARGA